MPPLAEPQQLAVAVHLGELKPDPPHEVLPGLGIALLVETLIPHCPVGNLAAVGFPAVAHGIVDALGKLTPLEAGALHRASQPGRQCLQVYIGPEHAEHRVDVDKIGAQSLDRFFSLADVEGYIGPLAQEGSDSDDVLGRLGWIAHSPIIESGLTCWNRAMVALAT